MKESEEKLLLEILERFSRFGCVQRITNFSDVSLVEVFNPQNKELHYFQVLKERENTAIILR